MEESFGVGGYYRWDVTPEITVLSINSIYMNDRNEAIDQIELV